MFSPIFVLFVAAVQLASAHFHLAYPPWRASSMHIDGPYSQWVYPCAGVPADVGNRTDWPVDGGALSVTLHHAWTYLFVNVGLGDNVANFNISLTPQLLNTTGRGDLCLPKLSVPEGTVGDGQRATLQVITNDGSGASLYNCADITFRANTSAYTCANNSVTAEIVGTANVSQSSPPNESTSTSPSESASAPPDAAAIMTTSSMATTILVGVMVTFAIHLGL